MRNIINKRTVIILVFMLFTILGALEMRSVWVTPWDLTSEEKIDQLIQDCLFNNINEILAEVRYRGDALYQPNRVNNRFTNNEERSYILEDSSFDPLLYLIQKAKAHSIKVQAWVTVFVITPNSPERLSFEHLYFKNRTWLTFSAEGERMTTTTLEGAYLDPYLPEVRDYLANVFADIAINYDIDGIHLDYIRYPNHRWGFHPASTDEYEKTRNEDYSVTWEAWKEKQVTETVRIISERVKSVKPYIEISAAVKPDPFSAAKYYGQNWADWLDKNYVDTVYLMAYQTKDASFNQLMQNIPQEHAKKIIVGLRAWSDTNSYPSYLLRNKTVSVIQGGYKGVSFFSYDGIKTQSYFSTIKPLIHLFKKYNPKQIETNYYNICGKIKGINGKPIAGAKVVHNNSHQVSYTDYDGVFTIYQIKENTDQIQVEYFNINTVFTAHLSKNEKLNYKNIFMIDVFPEESQSLHIKIMSDNKSIYLAWTSDDEQSFALYRKKIYSPNEIIDNDFQFIKLVNGTLKQSFNFADSTFVNSYNYSYIDDSAEPFAQYEYRLINNDLLVQAFARAELDFTLYPIEFSTQKTEDGYEITTLSEDTCLLNWSILDINETPLFYGISQTNSDKIKWNGKTAEDEKPTSNLFIFEYQVKPLGNENMFNKPDNKWYRKYFH
ncbi:MAG: family 10 glycosylhydrolase [Candidatus Cloacimonadales bacterium]|jgi:uncharacterized lipoprotein YddW (UPF0748 family)|nr:family 10 glycosylhydrolase [Candidatus Cloacimonadota bacterium]MDD2650574.1 family 10 glycosylhydrolase [Candidatus Cloacimonadota bacterium]MDD3501072.1 family 10 glycosylhydrolase [Candidatus Cloacimonadota bacterium]MDX9977862.1 family 10 glycosylhydrolase [Candidatus Cloacimonadales bacterium]